jgi:type IV secretory pathway TraG/TraD family ATPase VirD4
MNCFKKHYLALAWYGLLTSLLGTLWLTISHALFLLMMHLPLTLCNPLWFYDYCHDQGFTDLEIKKLFFSLAVPFVAGILFYVKRREAVSQGNARWASFIDIQKAGFFVKQGIDIGKKWSKYLFISGHEHVIVFAPSGTGKTRAIAIPNLLTWEGSIVANDVKLELYEKTAKFREQKGSQCFIWNLVVMMA